ncbi:NAD(P)/FAD-dependent oxidoreductase [Microvirga brassicacearum]|uniref:FAD-binding oxidoreductase n=1 Tax=Microvirga brassicacearum TaxID=2580413 RepID=A0A5N3P6X7_9HYPH|nr:FAD-binding oxidoreductase [Microvirga brassicacearum]KAB0265482.1 FAD-binding oxidoreductase [Microvirga brassicacearum]
MQFDYLVIGAGVSGASAAFELAASGSVALIEAENVPGYHSTGRSAALYTRNYGVPIVQRINAASHDFFMNPPPGFAEYPLLTPRGSLTVAGPGDEDRLEAVLALSSPGNAIELIPAAQALSLAPVLRPEQVGAAALEGGVMDMDVAALHQGYLRGLRQRGGTITCGSRVERLERRGGLWVLTAADVTISGRIIVNAAGAWADEIGAMAGAVRLNLVPKRRTAILIDSPAGLELGTMPAVEFIDGEAYFKPDAGKIMASPGDQTPAAPHDAQPEEWDVAVLVDWLESRTTLSIRRIAHSWAGLRSFVDDEVPVVGFDRQAENFFWLAGQGGFGIMMAPALSKAARNLIVSGMLPLELRNRGIEERHLSPDRLLNA